MRSEPKNPDDEPEELSLQEETLEDLDAPGGDDVVGGRMNVPGGRGRNSPGYETEAAGCGSGGCQGDVSTPSTSCVFCSPHTA